MICCKTVIGKGSPNKSGTSEVHGAALGDEEIELTREEIGWKYPPFEVPDHVYEAWNNEKYGQAQEDDWNSMFDDYSKNYSKEHKWNALNYKGGDINTSIIKTNLGRTIMVQWDETSPRPYSRLNLIQGTKGTLAGYPTRVALEGGVPLSLIHI